MSTSNDAIEARTFADLSICAAQRWPDATAIVDGARRLTFAELQRAAHAIGSALLACGVGRADHVIIVGPHCAEQVAIILGVASIGAVFIPLDPELPELRLSALLERAAPRLVVSPAPVGKPRHALAWLSWQTAVRCLEAARDPHNARLERMPQPPLPPLPTDVAYLFFTSGTRGQPKGVQIEHRALLTFFETYNAAIGITVGDRCLNTGPFYFDVCLLDVFMPLYFGATVYLGPRLPLPALFLGALSQHRITHFYAVGTWLSQITGDGRALDEHDLQALRVLQTGAEVCKPAVVNHWLARIPGLRFVNSYGPTEVTVGCIQFLKNEPGLLRARSCPIGRPHAGSLVKLVDAELRVLDAPFMVGELLLGGAQLMRGYWNAPDRTGRAFTTLKGERYYRSGDLAYRDTQGTYWFVGRSDDQVKFLGHRFHLRELQDVLALHPDVGAAAASVIRDARDYPQLALLAEVLRPASPALARSLRAHLRRRLPRYMLPAALGLLRSWPRSTSGKADMRAGFTDLTRAVVAGGRGDYVRSERGFEPLAADAPSPTLARP